MFTYSVNFTPLGKHAHEDFLSCKNENVQYKISDIFLIFAQNIDCGYTLEHVGYTLEQAQEMTRGWKFWF